MSETKKGYSEKMVKEPIKARYFDNSLANSLIHSLNSLRSLHSLHSHLNLNDLDAKSLKGGFGK